MQGKRLVTIAAAALLSVPLTTAAAQAAVPSNDTAGGAMAITALPTTITMDTTGATTDADDLAANANCGAPFTNASVWFTYTDTTGEGFVADMSASNYTGGFIVLDGPPPTGSIVACGPEVSGTRGPAGTTYYIVAFSDTPTMGGNLSVTFSKAPPAPTSTITVDPKGTVYRDGTAHITGTYSCLNADWWSEIDLQLTQTVGRQKITGYNFLAPLQCDGETHTWAADVTSDTGLFAGGKAANISLAFVCGTLDCSFTETSATIQLSRARVKG